MKIGGVSNKSETAISWKKDTNLSESHPTRLWSERGYNAPEPKKRGKKLKTKKKKPSPNKTNWIRRRFRIKRRKLKVQRQS